MPDVDAAAFEILAEVAVGIAGFGSVAIVLGRERGEWDTGDLFRTSVLFFATLGALFLALLPIGLATVGLAPSAIWRSSSLAMFLYTVVFAVVMPRWRRRYLDRKLWFRPLLQTLIVLGTTANLAAQLANALGRPLPPGPGPYFFGVVYFLLFGCLMLIRIVFVRSQPGG